MVVGAASGPRRRRSTPSPRERIGAGVDPTPASAAGLVQRQRRDQGRSPTASRRRVQPRDRSDRSRPPGAEPHVASRHVASQLVEPLARIGKGRVVTDGASRPEPSRRLVGVLRRDQRTGPRCSGRGTGRRTVAQRRPEPRRASRASSAAGQPAAPAPSARPRAATSAPRWSHVSCNGYGTSARSSKWIAARRSYRAHRRPRLESAQHLGLAAEDPVAAPGSKRYASPSAGGRRAAEPSGARNTRTHKPPGSVAASSTSRPRPCPPRGRSPRPRCTITTRRDQNGIGFGNASSTMSR